MQQERLYFNTLGDAVVPNWEDPHPYQTVIHVSCLNSHSKRVSTLVTDWLLCNNKQSLWSTPKDTKFWPWYLIMHSDLMTWRKNRAGHSCQYTLELKFGSEHMVPSKQQLVKHQLSSQYSNQAQTIYILYIYVHTVACANNSCSCTCCWNLHGTPYLHLLLIYDNQVKGSLLRGTP